MVSIENDDTTSNQGAGLNLKAGNDSGDVTLNVTTRDGTYGMRMLGDGRVGVGLSDPEARLQVNPGVSDATIAAIDVGIGLEFNGNSGGHVGMAVIDATSGRGKNRGFIGFRGNSASSMGHSHIVFGTADGVADDPAERMRIHNNGDVDLNTQVYGSGIGGDTFRDLLIRNDGRLGVDLSSERYKKNIVDIGDTDWIHNLRVVDFEWKSNDRKDWGLIAEEVHEIEPKLVSYNDDGTPESVNYSKLNVLLLKEIQNLKKRIEELEK
jgi:hypothetical protein